MRMPQRDSVSIPGARKGVGGTIVLGAENILKKEIFYVTK